MATTLHTKSAEVVGLALALALAVCFGCGRTTDVAGHIASEEPPRLPSGAPESANAPFIPANAGSETPGGEPSPSGAAEASTPRGAVPAPQRLDAGAPTPFELDGGPFNGGFRDGGPFGERGPERPMMGWPGPQGEGLWMSGWPLNVPMLVTAAWPLEESLTEFFGPSNVESGYQVGVWVEGEAARVLTEWWNSLAPDGAESAVFDGQRYVATQDTEGSVFAVSAERPPGDTEFLFPIPNAN